MVRSLGGEDALEESLTIPSSILAWRIPMDRGAWQTRKELDTIAMAEQSTAQVSVPAVVGAVETGCSAKSQRFLVQKMGSEGTSLVVQCLRLNASNAGGWV